MSAAEKDQETRASFYSNAAVARFLMAEGVPKTTGAFRRMVESGSSESLDGKKGAALIACLGKVMFSKHPQQINVMDKVSGKTIASFS